MHIFRFPEEILRQKCEDIVFFDELLHAVVTQMTELMYEENGIGLAAPQVGINRNLIVVDPTSGEDSKALLVLVNPKIIFECGSVESEEGCLSIPGLRGTVTRSEMINVEFHDVNGEKKSLTAQGILSIVIQHEIDHLNGILLVDRIVKNIKTSKKKIQKVIEKTA